MKPCTLRLPLGRCKAIRAFRQTLMLHAPVMTQAAGRTVAKWHQEQFFAVARPYVAGSTFEIVLTYRKAGR
jgi:hypothetical protein